MSSAISFRGLWRTLEKDPFSRIFALFFLAIHLPYLLPAASDAQLEDLGGLYSTLFLMPALMLACWNRRHQLGSKAERDLWGFIALAYSFWWCQGILSVFTPSHLKGTIYGLVNDGLFTLFYLSWFFAVAIGPHLETQAWPERWLRSLRSIGLGVLVWGLFGYFSVVPLRLQSDPFLAWVPSLYFYVALDLLLTLRFATLAAAAGPRWRLLYGLLSATTLTMAVMDLLEALIYQGAVQWTDPRTYALWSLPFVPLALAARLRHHHFPAPEGKVGRDLVDHPPGSDERPDEGSAALAMPGGRGPLVTVAFLFPVAHFFAHQLGWLDASAQAARDAVVLFCVVLLGTLATAENLLLLRMARRAREAKRQLLEMRVAKAVAEHSERVKSRFLANVSHELRTPMNGILGMVGLLLKGELTAAQRRRATALRAAADGLLLTFDDLLEYSKLDAGELSCHPEPGHAAAAPKHPSAEPLRLRVLLVEDNPINQVVTQHQLEAQGCVAEVASNGREALALLGESRFDLVLMDIQMPEMDGYETTRRYRREETTGRLPIIAVTAHAFEGDRRKCLQAGMDEFLPKPFTEGQLRKVLERFASSTTETISGSHR